MTVLTDYKKGVLFVTLSGLYEYALIKNELDHVSYMKVIVININQLFNYSLSDLLEIEKIFNKSLVYYVSDFKYLKSEIKFLKSEYHIFKFSSHL